MQSGCSQAVNILSCTPLRSTVVPWCSIPSKKASKEGPKLKPTVDASEETPEGKTKAAEKKLEDSLRDARVKFLEDNISDEALVGLFPKIEQNILAQDPQFLPILTWRLRFEEKKLTKQIQVQLLTAACARPSLAMQIRCTIHRLRRSAALIDLRSIHVGT